MLHPWVPFFNRLEFFILTDFLMFFLSLAFHLLLYLCPLDFCVIKIINESIASVSSYYIHLDYMSSKSFCVINKKSPQPLYILLACDLSKKSVRQRKQRWHKINSRIFPSFIVSFEKEMIYLFILFENDIIARHLERAAWK